VAEALAILGLGLGDIRLVAFLLELFDHEP